MTALQRAVISPKQPILTKNAALSGSPCTWFVFRVPVRALPALLNCLWIESIPECPGNAVLLCYSADPTGQSSPCCIQLGSGQGSWDAPEGLPPVHRISCCSYLLVPCRSRRENQEKLIPDTIWKDCNKRCKNEKLSYKQVITIFPQILWAAEIFYGRHHTRPTTWTWTQFCSLQGKAKVYNGFQDSLNHSPHSLTE